jgi:hypothetical protein
MALAYQLLVSVDPPPESGADAAWESEITARIARYDEDGVHALPASEFFSRLCETAPGQ